MRLTRRSFTSRSMAALVGASLHRSGGAALSAESPLPTVPLNTGWSVSAEGVATQSNVTLPHTVVPLSWRNWQPDSWQRVWTYRRTLQIDRAEPGQRILLHVERAMASATVSVNGIEAGSHEGGFLPFECDLTHALRPGSNELSIRVDARWLDVPPSGSPRGVDSVDYYLPGGITGAVTLEYLPPVALRDVHAVVKDVLSVPALEVSVDVEANEPAEAVLTAQLQREGAVVAKADQPVKLNAGAQAAGLTMKLTQPVELWSPDAPSLYQLVVSLRSGGRVLHSRTTRIGLREARFEPDGFYLNGQKTRLFGLDRHELFPYVGFAASPRALRRDAAYLRNTLNCNVVRCSHYPQSSAFLDACDELGLMVWEEIPGWQYIGDAPWRQVALKNVEDMVRRDRNRPSVIVWGTRVNESPNDPGLYTQTRALAKKLDPTRPTSGSMTPSSRRDWKERWHEDVFAFDDYHAAPDGTVGIDPALPGVPYMLAETVGQYSYGTAKNFLRRYRRAGVPEDQNQQAVLHAQAHDRAAQDPRNAGVIAWCAYDYGSPLNAWEGIKCPGVADSFRIPKLGAAFYMSQVDAAKRVVLEASFYWDEKLHATAGPAVVFSNCDELRLFLDDKQIAILQPDRKGYPKLRYPPFFADLPWDHIAQSALRIDGYIAGTKRISKSFDGSRKQDKLWITADDQRIAADGIDSTRIAFGVCDRFGNTRPSAAGVIRVQHTGPGILVGDTEFPLEDSGAVGAVWLRGISGAEGIAVVTVQHGGYEPGALRVRIS